MISLLENNIRPVISAKMGDRHAKSDDNKKILYRVANIIYHWARNESLPKDEISFC